MWKTNTILSLQCFGRFPEKFFIVHGHDNDALQSVARFISRIGLEEIILSERPDGSRTIIEKFEAELRGCQFCHRADDARR
ncbi:TIR domain-containing protein [Escherichia coli]